MFDYSGWIQTRMLPGLMDTRFVKPLNDLYAIGTFTDEQVEGTQIKKRIQTGYTSAARNFDRNSVDPTTVGVPQYADAAWNKVRQEHAIEISYIDIDDAAKNGFQAIKNLVTKEINDGLDALMEKVYADVYSQMRLDLADGTYSDAALSRSTYPALATGYYNTTDTAITTDILRTTQDTVKLDQNGCDPRNYTFSTGPAVMTKARKAIATLTGVSWNMENNGSESRGGYGPIMDFEGSKLAEVQGMTTGDLFYTRKEDLIFHEHMGMNTTVLDKTSGRFSIKIIWRIGVNSYVFNPGKNGFLTQKD